MLICFIPSISLYLTSIKKITIQLVMQQDLKSKETQDLIINKSFELFYSQGYNNTSIPD